MKKMFVFVTLLIMLVGAVSATDTTLSEDDLTMDYNDVRTVEFCINESDVPLDVSVVVDPICKDLNSLVGCNSGDTYNPTGFSVVPNEATTGADGCVDLTLTTSLSQGQEGLFYYTVNGQVGGSTVGSESGRVFVPEFGIIATLGILSIIGIFVVRKRN